MRDLRAHRRRPSPELTLPGKVERLTKIDLADLAGTLPGKVAGTCPPPCQTPVGGQGKVEGPAAPVRGAVRPPTATNPHARPYPLRDQEA
jgi:hypothetical protein